MSSLRTGYYSPQRFGFHTVGHMSTDQGNIACILSSTSILLLRRCLVLPHTLLSPSHPHPLSHFRFFTCTPLSEYTIYNTQRYIFLSASTSVQNLLLLYMYQSSYDTMSMILFSVHCIPHIKHTHTHTRRKSTYQGKAPSTSFPLVFVTSLVSGSYLLSSLLFSFPFHFFTYYLNTQASFPFHIFTYFHAHPYLNIRFIIRYDTSSCLLPRLVCSEPSPSLRVPVFL